MAKEGGRKRDGNNLRSDKDERERGEFHIVTPSMLSSEMVETVQNAPERRFFSSFLSLGDATRGAAAKKAAVEKFKMLSKRCDVTLDITKRRNFEKTNFHTLRHFESARARAFGTRISATIESNDFRIASLSTGITA